VTITEGIVESTPPQGTFTAISLGGGTGWAVDTDGYIVCWGVAIQDASRQPVSPP
jgi:hypothetical protein